MRQSFFCLTILFVPHPRVRPVQRCAPDIRHARKSMSRCTAIAALGLPCAMQQQGFRHFRRLSRRSPPAEYPSVLLTAQNLRSTIFSRSSILPCSKGCSARTAARQHPKQRPPSSGGKAYRRPYCVRVSLPSQRPVRRLRRRGRRLRRQVKRLRRCGFAGNAPSARKPGLGLRPRGRRKRPTPPGLPAGFAPVEVGLRLAVRFGAKDHSAFVLLPTVRLIALIAQREIGVMRFYRLGASLLTTHSLSSFAPFLGRVAGQLLDQGASP